MSILLYLLVLVFVILSRDVAAEGAGTEKAENIYQLSKQKDLLNQPVRMTAALIECLNGSVCQQKVVVNAWLSLEVGWVKYTFNYIKSIKEVKHNF